MRVLILAGLLVLATPLAAQSMGRGGGGEDHQTIHALLEDHEAIERRVVDVPGGVETWTESEDPEVAARIRTHVRQMEARLGEGRRIRQFDPLFVAIFDHADAIDMVIEDTPRGVRVVETSDDPEVVALIRQHARRAVSEFVAGGMERAHQPTPMPEAAGALPIRLPAVGADDVRQAMLYEGDARVVGLAFRAGQGLASHSTDVEAFVLVTEGSARVTVVGAVLDLTAGEGVVLPASVPHAVDAVTDVRAVLVRSASEEAVGCEGMRRGRAGGGGSGCSHGGGGHGSH